MGFDNDCILNIQSLAWEYFCPVCRTLVYPNEALQSQCTHLYCKPCLAYVVNSTQACPYDGYLVTEAGSKPLTESNKALAEIIGKTLVHCLYHRSGCTWQGSLSDCTSHCSGCAFGNSPVVCNRCGVQIVHRQAQEHAQTCNLNGANAQLQPGTASVRDSSTSGAVVVSDKNSGTQPGVHNLQSSAPQTVAVPPGQNPNEQGNVNPHSHAVAPNAVPTPEQCYQYQQYYQQYPGYDPYQQAFQQYYPYQPQAGQQIQQHLPLVQGQPHPHLQPTLPLVQFQSQVQVQPQPHTQLPVSHPALNVPQGQPQPRLYPLAPLATQNQNPVEPNQSHAQVQTEPHGPHPTLPPPPPPPPHGFLPLQPYPQAHLLQHMQGPQIQYHQQVQLPQAPLQPHPHPPGHPQAQYLSQPQQHSQPHPPQANQPPTLNPPHLNQYSSIQPVTGHLSYQQPQGHQHTQHAPPQHMMYIQQPSGVSLPPMQGQSQFPQPPANMRPLQPHAFPPNQPPSAFLPPHQQQINPNDQHTASIQQRPVMQPQQHMSQQYMQQAPPFAVQVSAQVQNPLHLGHFTQQQSQLRPQGPPQAMQLHPPPYIQPQHSVAVARGMQPHLSQSYVARSVMPNHEVQYLQFPQSTGSLGGSPQHKPPQHSSNQLSATPSYGNTVGNQLQASSEQPLVPPGFLANAKMVERKDDQTSERGVEQKDAGSPSQKSLEKDVTGLGEGLAEGKSDPGLKRVKDVHKPLSEGVNSYRHEERRKDASEGFQSKDAAADALIRRRINEKGKERSLGPSAEGGKASNSQATGASLKQADKNVANVSWQSSAESKKAGGSHTGNNKDYLLHGHGPVGDESGGFQGGVYEQSSHPSQFTDHGRHQLPPMPYGSFTHQRPHVPSMSQALPPTGPPSDGHLQGHISLGPLGPGPRGLELQYGAPPGQYNQGHTPSLPAGFSRMSQGGLVGPPMSDAPPGFESHHRLVKRAPTLRGPEVHSGPPRPITPMDVSMFANHSIKPFPMSSHMGSSEASPNFRNNFISSRPMDRGPPAPGMDGSHRNHDKGSHGLNYDIGQNVDPGAAPGGFFPSSRPGALHPNDSGEGGFFPPSSYPRLGTPGFRNNYTHKGFGGPFPDESVSFDNLLKRKPVSTGWCRICRVDCETVEGLDMHSQTREHQKMTMDMVISIKEKNGKRPKTSKDHSAREEANKSRNVGFPGRGKEAVS